MHLTSTLAAWSAHDTRLLIACALGLASIIVLISALGTVVRAHMRGVIVRPGRSTVVFTYRSGPRSIGELISLIAIALLLAYAVGTGIRRRRVRGAGY